METDFRVRLVKTACCPNCQVAVSKKRIHTNKFTMRLFAPLTHDSPWWTSTGKVLPSPPKLADVTFTAFGSSVSKRQTTEKSSIKRDFFLRIAVIEFPKKEELNPFGGTEVINIEMILLVKMLRRQIPRKKCTRTRTLNASFVSRSKFTPVLR